MAKGKYQKRKKDVQDIFDDNILFKFINPYSNDYLSTMKGRDLQEFMILLDEYYLSLRDNIGLSLNDTFGIEIEFENANYGQIKEKLINDFSCNNWIIHDDISLTNGGEISSPVLYDNKKTWNTVERVCSIASECAKIGDNAGGHIHIGTQILGNEPTSWLHFIKLWSVYEKIIFRFTNGEYLTARPSLFKYARPMMKDFWRDYNELSTKIKKLEDILFKISHERNQAVNFYNVYIKKCSSYSLGNTIEFRCPNGTLDAIIWQNNVNLLVKLLNYAKSSKFDDDIVTQRYRANVDKYDSFEWYDEVYLDEALELSDMLFSNNLDKIYFLKQYLKSLELSNCDNEYLKSKTLTMKK